MECVKDEQAPRRISKDSNLASFEHSPVLRGQPSVDMARNYCKEAKGLASKNSAAMALVKKVSFLILPRELRDMVYRNVFLDPTSTVIHQVDGFCYMHNSIWPRDFLRSYWKSKTLTSLLRVNRQIRAEAMELFFLIFTLVLRLPPYSCGFIGPVLQRTMSARARTLISNVQIKIVLQCNLGNSDTKPALIASLFPPASIVRGESELVEDNDEDDDDGTDNAERRRRDLEVILRMLPSARNVELVLGLHGLPVPAPQFPRVVARIVRITEPLRHIPRVVVHENENGTSQGIHILAEVRKALGCS